MAVPIKPSVYRPWLRSEMPRLVNTVQANLNVPLNGRMTMASNKTRLDRPMRLFRALKSSFDVEPSHLDHVHRPCEG